jgi:predicted nucleic acid-binding protein
VDVVVDASVSLAWCFGDEDEPDAERVLDRLRSGEISATVPAVWPAEVTNGLLVAERKGRTREADTARLVGLLAELPITVESSGIRFAGSIVVGLAREHGLTVYDASYLELAERLGAPLATLDAQLRRAAQAAGVSLAP